jgi:hypothetical protein
MPHTRIVLRCPACGSTVTDPVAILAARRWQDVTDGIIRMGCLRCQKAGRPDQEMQEERESVLVVTEHDIDVSDCIDVEEE